MLTKIQFRVQVCTEQFNRVQSFQSMFMTCICKCIVFSTLAAFSNIDWLIPGLDSLVAKFQSCLWLHAYVQEKQSLHVCHALLCFVLADTYDDFQRVKLKKRINHWSCLVPWRQWLALSCILMRSRPSGMWMVYLSNIRVISIHVQSSHVL